MIVENGWGDGGWKQRVISEGQALVLSESQSEARHKSNDGNVFLVQSNFITSSASADAFVSILYFKNDSTTKNIHIGHLRTCNEVAAKWKFIKNPTSISNGSAITAENVNFSSSITLDATIESGSATSATTGGTGIGTWIQGGPGHSNPDFSGALILGPQDSFVLEMAPFSAVAGEVCVTLECWQID